MKKIISTILFLIPALYGSLSAQDSRDVSDSELLEMDLEDLMQIVIKSASSKEESLFEAPVASYSITKAQIEHSGVNSIPEALRLCPDLIVRETANGSYDVHIRGFDNLARYTGTHDQINLYTLVMIDDRPVFNYNQGGTFWEALPIDLIDVERIEVVRGPSSALFGPNAVTGVINIITKRTPGDMTITSRFEAGSPQTTIANLSLGKKLNDNLDLIVSGNWQRRLRSEDQYYLLAGNSFTNRLDTVDSGYPNYIQSDLALERYGINAFLDYQKNDLNLRISGGTQQSDVQKAHLNNGLAPLAPSGSRSAYLSADLSYKGWKGQFSIIDGYDNVLKQTALLNTEYDYTNYNLVLDYDWQVNDRLMISPTFNHQSATYNDKPYMDENGKPGFFNDKKNIQSYAFSLRADYTLDKLRLIGAARGDKFNYPDKPYLSYQFAATYQIDQNWLVRAVHSRSNSGSFLGAVHLDAAIQTQAQIPGLPVTIPTTMIIEGDKNIKLARVDLSEIGVRAKINDVLNFDLTLFTQHISDLAFIVATDTVNTFDPLNPFIPTSMTFYSKHMNLPLEARQNGITLSMSFMPHKTLQFSPFVTIQETRVRNQPTFLAAGNQPGHIDEENEGYHKSTPTSYGGFYLNYRATRNLNVNFNSYVFGQHRLYNEAELATPTEVGKIDNKWILNGNISYQVVNGVKLYLNVKNILNKETREHFGTDRIGRYVGAGARINL